MRGVTVAETQMIILAGTGITAMTSMFAYYLLMTLIVQTRPTPVRRPIHDLRRLWALTETLPRRGNLDDMRRLLQRILAYSTIFPDAGDLNNQQRSYLDGINRGVQGLADLLT